MAKNAPVSRYLDGSARTQKIEPTVAPKVATSHATTIQRRAVGPKRGTAASSNLKKLSRNHATRSSTTLTVDAGAWIMTPVTGSSAGRPCACSASPSTMRAWISVVIGKKSSATNASTHQNAAPGPSSPAIVSRTLAVLCTLAVKPARSMMNSGSETESTDVSALNTWTTLRKVASRRKPVRSWSYSTTSARIELNVALFALRLMHDEPHRNATMKAASLSFSRTNSTKVKVTVATAIASRYAVFLPMRVATHAHSGMNINEPSIHAVRIIACQRASKLRLYWHQYTRSTP
eukprot:Amastigsp_a677642_17.p2 type:complete len:291 gc:universal Amastigsp_a677642_17:1746-874(-)